MLGSSTDDTDQAVFVMRALASGKPDIRKFAALMKECAQFGIVEHRQGYCYDIGTTALAAELREGPAQGCEGRYERTGGVGNGSVMRTAPVGCFMFWNEEDVMKNAALFGSATHYHSDCNCAEVLVSRFIQKRVGIIEDFSIEDTLNEALKFTRCKDYEILHEMKLEKLKLNGSNSGWAMTAAAVALVCLRNEWSCTEA